MRHGNVYLWQYTKHRNAAFHEWEKQLIAVRQLDKYTFKSNAYARGCRVASDWVRFG